MLITLSCGTPIVFVIARFSQENFDTTNTLKSQNISWKTLAYKYYEGTLSEKFNILITVWFPYSIYNCKISVRNFDTTNIWKSKNISWKSLAYKYYDSTLSAKLMCLSL